MRLKLISCKIITRELSYLIAQSDNKLDVTFLRKGFHDEPDKLRQAVQAEIDLVESGGDVHTNGDAESDEDFAAILIGYGLCSNGVVGLTSTKYPLVIPRAHDCITFLLGARGRYQQYFHAHPGTFWYSQCWLENSPVRDDDYLGRLRRKYQDKGFDDEDIEFLLEAETAWIKNYSNAAYIGMPEAAPRNGDADCRAAVRHIAQVYGWGYDELEGDISLLRDFVDGNWREEDFLIVQPGQTVAPSYGEDVIKAVEQ